MDEDENVERTEKYKGHTIKILWDREPTNPCEDFDSLGRMVCWHRNYNLGHDQPKESPEEWLRAQVGAGDEDERTVGELLAEFEKDHLVMPLFLFDHSGITISVKDFRDQWDSGQVGWVYVSHKGILKEYGGKRITARRLEKARKVLEAEVKTYDDYLTGMVFGYTVEGPDGEDVPDASCWGYYGYPDGVHMALDDAKAAVDYVVHEAEIAGHEKAAAEVEALQF